MTEITEQSKDRVKDLIKQWITQYHCGIESIKSGCKALVEAFEIDPKEAWRLVEESNVPPAIVKRMLEVGRGIRCERLLGACTRGEMALAKCDITFQRVYVEEPVPVVNPAKPDDFRLIPVSELTPEEVKQVFNNRSIRSTREQRSYLESRQVKAPIQKLEFEYQVKRGKVIFLKPCEVTVDKLLDLIKEANR